MYFVPDGGTWPWSSLDILLGTRYIHFPNDFQTADKIINNVTMSIVSKI